AGRGPSTRGAGSDRADCRRGHSRSARRERAWRNAGRSGYPEQRHAQFHQHRCRGRRRARDRMNPAIRNPQSAIRNPYVDLARPFTLVAPALGFISGALTAIGAAPRDPLTVDILVAPLIGSAMAAMLNAGNNALNQIYDVDIDRV